MRRKSVPERSNPDDPVKYQGIAYVECSGMPEELKQEGIELICDMEVKKYPNPGVIKISAHPMNLLSYQIQRIPDDTK